MLNIIDSEPRLEEAYENLRLIREVMERSTKHSSLSGRSGLLVGLWAILGVGATRYLRQHSVAPFNIGPSIVIKLAAIWLVVLIASAATDYILNKRVAPTVGKFIFSVLGARIAQAAVPAFAVGLVLTFYLLAHGMIFYVWGYWMLCYGLAICSVGLFSVRPVSFLGGAFIVAGALTLFLPPSDGLWMMTATFGGFHMCYGLYTGIVRKEW
jgi:hypothetical protein